MTGAGGEKGQGQGDREKGRETGKGDRERGDSQARIEIGEREARRDRRGGRALFVNKMPSLLECLGVLTAPVRACPAARDGELLSCYQAQRFGGWREERKS